MLDCFLAATPAPLPRRKHRVGLTTRKDSPLPKKEMHRIASGASLVSIAQISSYGLSFLRNLILARVLSKADYGIAAAFATTLLLIDVAAPLAFGQQVIQSPNGDDPEFQKTFHFLRAAAGFATSGTLLVLSPLMSSAFKLDHAIWAFALLAAVPLATGLEHLDRYRAQRSLDFWPLLVCDVVPQFVTTVVAWPLSLLLPDFRLILVLLIAKAVIATILSHLLASRPYRWCFHREFFAQLISFSWPLWINTVLALASQQGDQMLVGMFLSLEELAVLAIAVSSVSVGWYLYARVSNAIMLPILSQCTDQKELFLDRYKSCFEYAALFAALLVLPLAVAGGPVIGFLYGPRYGDAGLIAALIALAFSVRFLRQPAVIAAMSRADTLTLLLGEVGRAASFPLAIVGVASGGRVETVACAGIVGEAIAALTAIARVNNKHQTTYRVAMRPLLFLCMSIGIALAIRPFAERPGTFLGSIPWLAAYFVAVALAGFILIPTPIRSVVSLAASSTRKVIRRVV